MVTDNVFFTGSKSNTTAARANNYAAPAAPSAPAYASGAASDFEEVESDNDLPF